MKITEVSPQKNDPRRVNVYLDGEYSFSLDDVDALVLGIKAGREISEKELQNLLFESQFGKAKSKAMDILSRKSISTASLKKELTDKGYEEIIADEVINELTELGYLDDLAYAVMFLEMCHEKMWGIKKVRYELKQRGIDDFTIEDALCQMPLPTAEDIAQAIGAKYGYEDISDIKTKQRIMRHFAQRGFDFSDIEKAISIYSKKD